MRDTAISHRFNIFMNGARGSRPIWFSWYPVEERPFRDAASGANSVFLVDVAGGHGYDIQKFVQNVRIGSSRRVILQDLPHILDKITGLNDRIELMTYDFFMPQPIRGARVYFFHMIMHDWPDDACIRILRETAKAMKPGYSKLLINDMVIPSTNAPLIMTPFDLTMMAHHSGIERSERQWRALVPRAGLEIVRVWPSLSGEGIIEVMLPEG